MKVLKLSGIVSSDQLVEEFKKLEELGTLGELEELDLSGCEYLRSLPPLPPIKKLNLSGCLQLYDLPDALPEGLEECNFNHCGLIERLPRLPSTLRKLELFDCSDLVELPDLPKSLEVLDLSGCEIITTLGGNLPESLIELNLAWCDGLVELPNFSETSIERLNLTGVRGFDSFELPKNLQELVWVGCDDPALKLPKSLKKLRLIYDNEKISSLPVLHEGLEELSLKDCAILRDTSIIPSTVTKLQISGCSNLKSPLILPKNLEELSLTWYWDDEFLIELPETIRKLELKIDRYNDFLKSALEKNIKVLNLSLSKITNLPDGLPKGLEELNLSYCYEIHSLPDKLPESLKKMDLSGCGKIESLPPLPEGLEELNLSGCRALASLPGKLPESLKKMDLSGCAHVESLPTLLPEGLEELNLSGCRALTSLPGKLPESLKKLDLSGCDKIESLPPLPEGLEELNLSNCRALAFLPGKLPESLRTLDLSGCVNVSFPPSLPEGLEILNLSYCYSISFLPVLPSAIRNLQLLNCHQIKEIIALPRRLEKLILTGCSNLVSLPDLSQISITELDLSGCSKITAITTVPRNLWKLELIDSGINFIADLSSTLIDTLNLSNLQIEVLPEFPEYLESLNLSNCSKIRFLPRLPERLNSLNLSGCLALSDMLVEGIRELERNEVDIVYPQHFLQHIGGGEVSKRTDRLKKVIGKEYVAINRLFERFLSEGRLNRGIESLHSQADDFLVFFERASKDDIPWFEKIAEKYLEACVNQPLSGWMEILARIHIISQEDKFEAAKYLLTLNTIKESLSKLPEKKRPVKEIEVELFNAVIKEVYKAIGDKILHPWPGIPEAVLHEETIRQFITQDLLRDVLVKVEEILTRKPEEIKENLKDLSTFNDGVDLFLLKYIEEASLKTNSGGIEREYKKAEDEYKKVREIFGLALGIIEEFNEGTFKEEEVEEAKVLARKIGKGSKEASLLFNEINNKEEREIGDMVRSISDSSKQSGDVVIKTYKEIIDELLALNKLVIEAKDNSKKREWEGGHDLPHPKRSRVQTNYDSMGDDEEPDNPLPPPSTRATLRYKGQSNPYERDFGSGYGAAPTADINGQDLDYDRATRKRDLENPNISNVEPLSKRRKGGDPRAD